MSGFRPTAGTRPQRPDEIEACQIPPEQPPGRNARFKLACERCRQRLKITLEVPPPDPEESPWYGERERIMLDLAAYGVKL